MVTPNGNFNGINHRVCFGGFDDEGVEMNVAAQYPHRAVQAGFWVLEEGFPNCRRCICCMPNTTIRAAISSSPRGRDT